MARVKNTVQEKHWALVLSCCKKKTPHLHCEIFERSVWLDREEGHLPLFFPGTRESAFVYALAAAAVTHSIAQACTSGELPLCSCGSVPSEVPGPDFRWGGCGDNLRYGLQLGAAFADSPLKSSKLGTQALKAMNLHNNAAGRQVGMVPPTDCCSPAHLTAAWGAEVPNVRQ